MIELFESTLIVLHRTLRLDAREMAPSHPLGEVFGGVAARMAALAMNAGSNDFHDPDARSDDADSTDDNVLNIRGSKAGH